MISELEQQVINMNISLLDTRHSKNEGLLLEMVQYLNNIHQRSDFQHVLPFPTNLKQMLQPTTTNCPTQ